MALNLGLMTAYNMMYSVPDHGILDIFEWNLRAGDSITSG